MVIIAKIKKTIKIKEAKNSLRAVCYFFYEMLNVV